MVLLRQHSAVMDLLTDQNEQALAASLMVSLHAFDPDIVIGDHHRIQTAAESRRGNIAVASRAIRVTGVHVQIHNDFMHAVPGGSLVDESSASQV